MPHRQREEAVSPPPADRHAVFDACVGASGAVTTTPICMARESDTRVAKDVRPNASVYNPGADDAWVIKTRCCELASPATYCDSQSAASNGQTCYGSGQTWAEAQQTCANDGHRLCTAAELSLCCNTGCLYDRHLVWTADVC